MNNSGQKVAISGSLFERIYGPKAVSRFNMLKSVNVKRKIKSWI
jgi:HAE1 family hydrophobic/amphiphilic exporter-1